MSHTVDRRFESFRLHAVPTVATGSTSMGYSNIYAQRKYQKQWRQARRTEWISEHGPCACCNSWGELEVDHIDKRKKKYPVSSLWSLSKNNPKRISELAKCQVLCKTCHLRKTSTEYASLRRRKCRKGQHKLIKGNLYIHPKTGRRECLSCKKERRKNS